MPKGIRGFQKGNQLARTNRVPKKNLLPLIRERVLKALNKRLMIDNMLSKIPDVELLKFAQSIMPKDVSVKVDTSVQYISNTPRPVIDVPVAMEAPNEAPSEVLNDTVDTPETPQNTLKEAEMLGMHENVLSV